MMASTVKQDIELGREYKVLEAAETEREALLPGTHSSADTEDDAGGDDSYTHKSSCRVCWPTTPRFGSLHLYIAFLAGIFGCLLVQLFACGGPSCLSVYRLQAAAHENDSDVRIQAPPWVGSTTRHNFPPVSPTNAYPSYFPTKVGYAGGTPTGAEPALIATAPYYPTHTGAAQLVVPESTKSQPGKWSTGFDLFKKWGNLSPWYSVDQGAFGVDSSPETPDTCRITGLHLLHRHGARYPTAWASFGGPAKFATRLHETADKWDANGDLTFLNNWTYKLGEEILTPFGRQQMYDLGVTTRLKYGFLLENFTETNTIPVFRTESQNRMLLSAMNFALGFFGYPLEGQYSESITIEARGFNNTLAPYMTCPNAGVRSKGDRGTAYVKEWAAIYLADALARLSPQMPGLNLTLEDVYTMQQTCAYETVALGYSHFCELFTEEEWEGFNYAMDLYFWYDSAFGSPVARVQGIGYIQELVARLTSTPIEIHNTSTNATLDNNPITFPLNHSLYVDATHEVVVLNVLTALNLSTFAENGPLPSSHILPNRTFRSSQLAPFGTNVQFQLLECTSQTGPQIRIIINDGVAPLTGVGGCPAQKDGMCPLDTFVAAQKQIIQETDWQHDCYGDWTVPPGPAWNTTTGDPPK